MTQIENQAGARGAAGRATWADPATAALGAVRAEAPQTSVPYRLSGPAPKPVTSRLPEHVEMRLQLRVDPLKHFPGAVVVLL